MYTLINTRAPTVCARMAPCSETWQADIQGSSVVKNEALINKELQKQLAARLYDSPV